MVNTIIFDLSDVLRLDTGLNTELLEFLDTIKGHIHLFVFTNMDLTHNQDIVDLLKNTFEEVYSTSDFGMTKENPEAFTKLLDVLGVEPSKTLFVDDTEMNIIAAQRAGLQTIKFVGNEDLYKQFANVMFEFGG